MTTTTHPAPRLVSGYLAVRRTAGTPPPTPEEIRERLGWKLTQPPTIGARTHHDDR